MNDWQNRLTQAGTVPLEEMFGVIEASAREDGVRGGIGVGAGLLRGRLRVDPLAARWFVRGGQFPDALRALLSSAPVALAVAVNGANSADPVTGVSLEQCPMPRDLSEPEHRGSIQQLAALWKRAETVGLTPEICRAFDRVAAELYDLALNDLMALEEDRRRLIERED